MACLMDDLMDAEIACLMDAEKELVMDAAMVSLLGAVKVLLSVVQSLQ